ncbi:MAG: hypothetical protein H7841_06600 [Magnetospirillum sp. WYHS-4]
MAESRTWQHVGMRIDFHHPDSDLLELTPEAEDLYGAEKERARLFLRMSDGNRRSAEDLLAEWLAGEGRNFVDLAAGWGATGTLVLDYPPGRYVLETKGGRMDLRRLRLAFRRTGAGRVR